MSKTVYFDENDVRHENNTLTYALLKSHANSRKTAGITGVWHVKDPYPKDEWERVQRMRREDHPLVSGGQSSVNRKVKVGDYRVFKGGLNA